MWNSLLESSVILVELHDHSLSLSTLMMALQVCLNQSIMSCIHLLPFLTHTAVVDNDYVAVSGQLIQFNAGDVTQMHIIEIIDDDECENAPNEHFFSDITLDSGIPEISVTVPRATVIINDTDEVECGEYSCYAIAC